MRKSSSTVRRKPVEESWVGIYATVLCVSGSDRSFMRRVRAEINQNVGHIMPVFAILPDRASTIYLAQTSNEQSATREGEPSKNGMIWFAFVALLCDCPRDLPVKHNDWRS